jgi:hypothetical protein
MNTQTVESVLREILEDHGMDADEVSAVMKRVVCKPRIAEAWQQPWYDQSKAWRAWLWQSMRWEAIMYLEAKDPDHFALGLLRDSGQAHFEGGTDDA